jgi:hypothetical protein
VRLSNSQLIKINPDIDNNNPIYRLKSVVPVYFLKYELISALEHNSGLYSSQSLANYRKLSSSDSSSADLIQALCRLNLATINDDTKPMVTSNVDEPELPNNQEEESETNKSLNEKETLSKWRLVYETTGQVNVKFKSTKQLLIKCEDIKKSKLKFVNNEKSRINLKDSTNRLILTYQSKRIKKLPCLEHQTLSEFDKSTESTVPVQTPKGNRTITALTNHNKLIPLGKPVTDSTKSVQQNQQPTKIKKEPQENASLKVSEEKQKKAPSQLTKEKLTIGKKAAAVDKKTSKAIEEEQNKLKDEIKKIIENFHSKDTEKLKTESESKRKKNFWEPDSDSEYNQIKRLKPVKQEETINEHEEKKNKAFEINDELDGDDDIVVVTKLYLNIPPVQYSKQYYDSNMSAFEHQLRKLSSAIGLKNSLIKPQTTVTKTPINCSSRSYQQQQRIRQRYIHYIYHTKRDDAANEKDTQLDVDSLRNLYATNSSSYELFEAKEIHAGGFQCIHDAHFNKSSNFLRRTKSFASEHELKHLKQATQSCHNLLSDLTGNKRLTLNDYLKNKTHTHSVSSTTLASTISNPNINELSTQLIKQSPSEPFKTKQSPCSTSNLNMQHSVDSTYSEQTNNLNLTNCLDEFKHSVEKLNDNLISQSEEIDEKESKDKESVELNETKSKLNKSGKKSKSSKKSKKKTSKSKKTHKRSKYTSVSSDSSSIRSDIENYESSSFSSSSSSPYSTENESTMNETPHPTDSTLNVKLEEGEITEAKQHHKKRSKKRKIHRHHHRSVGKQLNKVDVNEINGIKSRGESLEAEEKITETTSTGSNLNIQSSSSIIDYDDFYCEYDLDESLMDTINSSACNEKSKVNETSSGSFAPSPVVQKPITAPTQPVTPIVPASLPNPLPTPITNVSKQMGLLPLPQTPQIKPKPNNQFNLSLQANRTQQSMNNNHNSKMNRSLNRSFSNGNGRTNLNSSLERYHKIMKMGSTPNSSLNNSLAQIDTPPFYSNPPLYDMAPSINSNQFESRGSFNQFNPMMNNSFMNYQGGPMQAPPPMTPELANPHIPFTNDFSSPMFNSPVFNNKPNFSRMTPNNNFSMINSHVMAKTPNLQNTYSSNYSMNNQPLNNNNNNAYHKQNYGNNYRPNKKPNRNPFNTHNRLGNTIDQEDGEIME